MKPVRDSTDAIVVLDPTLEGMWGEYKKYCKEFPENSKICPISFTQYIVDKLRMANLSIREQEITIQGYQDVQVNRDSQLKVMGEEILNLRHELNRTQDDLSYWMEEHAYWKNEALNPQNEKGVRTRPLTMRGFKTGRVQNGI